MSKKLAVEQLLKLSGPAYDAFTFGDFHVLPKKRLLMEGRACVPIGGRALDLLIALVARAGTLVSKNELMEAVWPETHVVEGNLTVHISALRRALKDGRDGRRYIVNSVGRGYCFVEPVTRGYRTYPIAAGPSQGNAPAIQLSSHNRPPAWQSRRSHATALRR